MVLDSENYLLRYVSNLNISRRKNSSKAIPEVQNIRIFYCFGDIDSIIMFCNTVYPSFVCNKNTYNIFITWNGLEFLNEHADEVWSFNDEKIVDMFYKKTNGIDNTSDGIYSLTRSLNENFFHVEGPQKYSKYFKTHLKQEYFDAVKTISFKFPALQSQSVINDYVINRMKGESNKVCIIPFKYAYHWDTENKITINQNQDVYEEVLKLFAKIDYKVLVIQNAFTLDLSNIVKNDNITFIKETNFEKILSMIKFCGMYLDIFSNSFTLGSFARVPTVSVIDKPSWMAFKKYEDVELFLQKPFYTFVRSFNYFSKTEMNTNQVFMRKIVNTVKLFYNRSVGSPNHPRDISFDTENFCKSKLCYFRTKKVFFLRSSNNA
jgi:hypothetical protein